MTPPEELMIDADLVEDSKTHSSGATIVKGKNLIKEKIGSVSISSVITKKEIDSAQKNIEKVKESYDQIIRPELERFKKSFELFVEALDKNTEHYVELCDAILNIKGSAGMNDYPLATEISRSFYVFLTDEDIHQPRGREILKLHSNALQLVFKQKMKGSGGEIGNQLVQDLHKLHNLNRAATT